MEDKCHPNPVLHASVEEMISPLGVYFRFEVTPVLQSAVSGSCPSPGPIISRVPAFLDEVSQVWGFDVDSIVNFDDVTVDDMD